MPCYHPRPAWYSRERNAKTGKRGVTFRIRDAQAEGMRSSSWDKHELALPCGKCIGCQLERSRQWAVRCLHESKLHEVSVAVTLTYDDEHLPPGNQLRPSDYQEFMKRLRWHRGEVRFFQCGEYGERFGRPHHHALLFGMDFPDKRFYRESSAGSKLYTSKELDGIWQQGQCTIGQVSFESAAYIARYVVKAHAESETRDGVRVRFDGRTCEYLTMSRKPGIGRGFVEKFGTDVYPSDQVVVRGVPCRPPRYYDQVKEKAAPSVMARIKARRRVQAVEQSESLRRQLGSSHEYVREEVKEAAVKFLKRSLEVS